MKRLGRVIKRIWRRAVHGQPGRARPFRDLRHWAREPDKRHRRYRRYAALAEWADDKRKDAKPNSRKRRRWAERRDTWLRKAKKNKPPDKPSPDADWSTSAGPPNWGGCDLILEWEVEPEVDDKRNVGPNSGKRSACFGNCASDHHESQVLASARDFPLVNDFGMAQAIRSALSRGTHHDFEHVFFEYRGVTFRLQIIAGTHGTGPHLHVGIRLIG